MDKYDLKDALEEIAQRDIPDSISVWSRVEAGILTEEVGMKQGYKLSASLAMAVAAILLVSTAGYALYRFLGSDAGLEGANEQNLITSFEVTAEPTVYSTPPLVTPISKWIEESSAAPATVIAEEVMQDVKITVNWAYADESRVAVRYTISGLNLPAGLDYGYGAMGTFALQDMNGNLLGMDGFSTAAENREDGTKVITAIYYGKLDAETTPTLDLKLSVRVGGFDAPYSPPGSEGLEPEMRNIPLMGSTEFEFSIPVYEGLELDVFQSVAQNGVEMRLEAMTVNRSHTEVVLCFDMPSAKDWQLWKTTLRIGDSGEYEQSLASNAISGSVKGDYGIDAPERCSTLGFDAPYDGSETSMTVTVPYLITSIPEVITPDRVELANQKLEPYGIVFEYRNRNVEIIQEPAGMEEWQAYRMAWDSLADTYDGPWIFTVPLSP